jgi:hypothetical protein
MGGRSRGSSGTGPYCVSHPGVDLDRNWRPRQDFGYSEVGRKRRAPARADMRPRSCVPPTLRGLQPSLAAPPWPSVTARRCRFSLGAGTSCGRRPLFTARDLFRLRATAGSEQKREREREGETLFQPQRASPPL